MVYFNPRSPCGERLAPPAWRAQCSIFQPTLPVRGATKVTPAQANAINISTHAPRAGSDDSLVK